jgi:hypothetical protein
MAKISVSAETESWDTRPAANDGWDNGDTAGRVSEVVAFVETKPDVYGTGDSRTKDMDGVGAGDTVWAVVADYESGSTFGRSGGHAQVLDMFTTLEEAEGLLAAAQAEPEKDAEGRVAWSDLYSFEYNGESYSRSWVGYFERLQEITVWELVVRRNPADPFRKGTGRYSYKRN